MNHCLFWFIAKIYTVSALYCNSHFTRNTKMSTATTVTEVEAVLDDEALAEEQLLEELENEEIPASIRESRLAELKRQTVDFQGLRDKQHGQYTELTEEKSFLDMSTSSEKCVVHFYHKDFRRCAIMDVHLKDIAEKYFETKFSKINVDNAKFFVEKLKIRILPAVICFKNGIVVDRIIGFDELGNNDSFPTKVLERRLNKSGVIDASELDDEEDAKSKSIFGFRGKKEEEDSDDENDW